VWEQRDGLLQVEEQLRVRVEDLGVQIVHLLYRCADLAALDRVADFLPTLAHPT
jgi:hypothetical protein